MPTARVIQDWEVVYPEPLALEAGDEVTLGKADDEWPGWVWITHRSGACGWAPRAYLEASRDGLTARLRRDYTARELPARAGEVLTLHFGESGWYWASNPAGLTGWVPGDCLEVQPG